MALPFSISSCSLCNGKKTREGLLLRPSSSLSSRLSRSKAGMLDLDNTRTGRLTAMAGESSCSFNLPDEPILKEALKEPVAFMGGMFAGLLRLDLNEDPLKEWVNRTVEASGLTEDIVSEGSNPEEEIPQQIEIE